jgi:uncharacterized protein YoxC
MPLYDALLAHSGHALLAQITVQAGWFAQFTAVLNALMTLAILVLAIAVVPAAWNFRKSYQKISDLLDRVYADINPLTHHASRITENIDYVTTALRADVQRASATLTDADRRLQSAIRRAEQRARDFDALLAVVQDETEGAFVSTASTVRGMRTGMQTLRDTLQLALRDVADAATAPVPAVPPASASTLIQDDALDGVREDLAAVDVRGPTPVRPSIAVRPTASTAPGSYGSFDETLDDAADDPTLDDELDQDEFDDDDYEDDALDGSSSHHGEPRPERPRVRPRRGDDD